MSGEKLARKIEQQTGRPIADGNIETAMKNTDDLNEVSHESKAINAMPTINDITSKTNLYETKGITRTLSSEQVNDTLSPSEESSINSKRGAASKLLTFALLLAVPAVMTGCNSTSNCNPEYENCSTGSGGGTGGAYYGGGGGSSKSSGSSDTSSSSSSSGVYKGLGSSGTKSSGG